MANTYYRGDDFDAFDQEWAYITADNIPEDWVIEKVAFRVGNIPTMIFKNPTFPIKVNLSSYETAGLKDITTCYMAIFDTKGRQQTLEGSWTFVTKRKVI